MRSVLDKLYFLLVFGEITFALAGITSWGAADDKTDLLSSNPILTICTALVIFGTIYYAYPKLPQLWRMILQLRWTFLLYAWLLLTVFWSENRPISAIAAVRLLLYLVSAGYIALRYRTDEILRFFARAFTAAAFFSVFAQYLFPHAASEDGAGWSGIFVHKNVLGFCMMSAVAVIVVQRGRWGIRRVASLLLCATLLVLSQSYTAILATIVTVFFILSQKVESRTKATIFIALSGSFCVFLILSDPLSLILSAGGRDSSLTGRDAVWAFAAAAIVQRPILGYGYAAFWADSDWTLQALHWSPPHAHNGVLQVLLDLGGIGLILTIALLVNTWRRARRVQKYDRSIAAPWMLTLLVMAFVHNLTEADLVSVKLVWYLIILGSFSLLRLENEARQGDSFSVAVAAPEAELATA